MLDEGLITRFKVSYVELGADECWPWLKSLAAKGYGQIKRTNERKQFYAHRVAYELATGVDPSGRCVCHSCDNMKCVNPKHLFLGTQGDNLQDMKHKSRHLFGEKNNQHVLVEKQVVQILALKGVMSQREIASRFGVSQGTIAKIHLGQRWQHLRKG
jgi:hypothetical protein